MTAHDLWQATGYDSNGRITVEGPACHGAQDALTRAVAMVADPGEYAWTLKPVDSQILIVEPALRRALWPTSRPANLLGISQGDVLLRIEDLVSEQVATRLRTPGWQTEGAHSTARR